MARSLSRFAISLSSMSLERERYLLVWLRQDDGTWKIAYDIWHRQPE